MVHIPLPFHSEIYVSIQEDLLLTKGHFKNILLFCFLNQTCGEGDKEYGKREWGEGEKPELTHLTSKIHCFINEFPFKWIFLQEIRKMSANKWSGA